jgi:hypothetical protein
MKQWQQPGAGGGDEQLMQGLETTNTTAVGMHGRCLRSLICTTLEVGILCIRHLFLSSLNSTLLDVA